MYDQQEFFSSLLLNIRLSEVNKLAIQRKVDLSVKAAFRVSLGLALSPVAEGSSPSHTSGSLPLRVLAEQNPLRKEHGPA